MVLINFSNAKPSGSEWAIKVDFKCHRHRTRLESRASRTDLAHNAELIMGRRGMSLLGSLGSLRNELEGMREREKKNVISCLECAWNKTQYNTNYTVKQVRDSKNLYPTL